MSSPSEAHRADASAISPCPAVFQFKSSQQFKRFVMFDHSNGKGRVFFHPAVAKELFGSMNGSHHTGLVADTEAESDGLTSSLVAHGPMVQGAYSSLQPLRGCGQNSSFPCKSNASTDLGTRISSLKPRASETVPVNEDEIQILDVQVQSPPCMVSETLACEEKPKVLAILPSADTILDCTYRTSLGRSNSGKSDISGMKMSEIAEASEPMHENTEDLDALLSSDEDDDDDVRSTGHSPEEYTGMEGGGDDAHDIDLNPRKRRRIPDDYEVPDNTVAVQEEKNLSYNVEPISADSEGCRSSRKQKIKKTVMALRRMIPGGALADTAFVLDWTIMYVRSLRNRVNQLEAIRRQTPVCSNHF